jgi:HD-GYP domain-containing protein (c-di-GMP phosphodiesterase class II)
MYKLRDDFANWTKMQDSFFDKILTKQKEIPARFKPKIRNNNVRDGYLNLPKEDPTVNYQEALFDASRSMIRFKNPRLLIKMIDKIINDKVGITHSAVLSYDSDKKSYVLADSRGMRGKRIPAGYVRLDLKNPLIEVFRERKYHYFFENGVVYHKELQWILESGQLLVKEVYFHNKLRLVLKEMELLDAELCVPCFFKKDLLGILILGKKKSGRNFIREEISLFATLANDAAIALSNARLIENLRRKVDEVEHLYEREHQLFINTAVTLAKAIDARDIYTHGHTERVTKYCMSVADELAGVSNIKPDERFREILYITGLLHDIGKIGIPDRILNKKGRLTSSEITIVERHPEIGASILFPICELNEVARCVRLHQEWYNGNGYPDGLKREEIPLISRIISVADTFDAITSDRPYRKKKSSKEAIKEIGEYSGTQFDPQIVEAFLSAHKKGQINSIDQHKSSSNTPRSINKEYIL